MVILSIFMLVYYYFNVGERLIRWRYGVKEGVTLNGIAVERMLEGEVTDLVKDLNKKIMTPPRNAYWEQKAGQIVGDIPGVKVGIATTVQKVMEAGENTPVELNLISLEPEITRELLESINNEIGYYYTWAGGGGNRLTNMQLAASSINNYLMLPGTVFSFHKVVGPCTVERGYRLAPVIIGDRVVPGVGGGICQVSSTLYNAVLEAGLEVIERYPHSRPVGYVPPGRDATISDSLDFKFRNNTDKLILIKMSVWDRVEARILQN